MNRKKQFSLSRRDFIYKSALAASAAILNPFSLAKADEEYDCLVLGAGISGLTAARALMMPATLGPYQVNGYNPRPKRVLVLEGSNRLGGRIHTDSSFLPGINLELGAENLHMHRNMSPIWDEVDRYNLNVKYLNPVRMGYMSNRNFAGNTVNLPTAAGYTGLKANIFEDLSSDDLKMTLEDWRRKYSGRNGLLYEVMRATFNSPGPLDDNGMEGFIAEGYPTMINSKFESRVVEGNAAFIDHISQGITVLRNQRIAAINYGINGVTVTCDNGHIYRAKTAISTFAIGMLKKGNIKFTPGLPESKLIALDALGIGNSIKVMLPFKKRFWPDNMSILVATDPATVREAGRVYFQVEAGNAQAVPVLNTLIADEDANRLLNKSEDEIVQMICRDLDRMFPNKKEKAISLLERTSDGSLKYLCKNWVTDPFTMGSSSFIKQSPNGIRPSKVRRTLASAVETPNLFWAGSDFSTDARIASLDGAHATGLRAAFQVHTLLDTKKSAPINFTDKLFNRWLESRVPAEIKEEYDESIPQDQRPEEVDEVKF